MELNRKNVRKIILIILFTVVCFLGLQNISQVFTYIKIFFSFLTPLLLGLSIAFILNLPMKAIERFCFKTGGKHDKIVRKIKRPLSIIMTFALVILVLAFVMFIIIPELVDTFEILKGSIPVYITNINNIVNDLVLRYPELQEKLTLLTIDWENVFNTIFSFIQNGAGSVVSVATGLISGLWNCLLGIFFAIYILSQKEKLQSQAKRILKAFMPERKKEDGTVIPAEKRVDKVLKVSALVNKTFSNFITGQCTEAVILGVMFFIVLSVFGYKYALMISVLTMICALVPIFGPWLSTAVSFLLILISTGFMPALWFVVIAVVLQQIEGNFIYPYVVGNSVGLPSLWVLTAVTLGGSMMGVIGMLIYIPIFSVIYTLIKEETNLRLKQK